MFTSATEFEDEPKPDVDQEDAETKPICGLPADGVRKVDRSPPLDDCCRIYELQDFYGVYLNICAESAEVGNVAYLDTLEGTYSEERQAWTWDNEVSSWKCGKQVGLRLCYDSDSEPGGGECIDPSSYEEGHPRSGNARMGSNNAVSKLILTAPQVQDMYGGAQATFFDKPNCEGHS